MLPPVVPETTNNQDDSNKNENSFGVRDEINNKTKDDIFYFATMGKNRLSFDKHKKRNPNQTQVSINTDEESSNIISSFSNS